MSSGHSAASSSHTAVFLRARLPVLFHYCYNASPYEPHRSNMASFALDDLKTRSRSRLLGRTKSSRKRRFKHGELIDYAAAATNELPMKRLDVFLQGDQATSSLYEKRALTSSASGHTLATLYDDLCCQPTTMIGRSLLPGVRACA